MELILIKPNSLEWDFMWNWLASHPINEGIEEPSIAINNSEAWQYLGSFREGKRIIHEFRHRSHPKTNKRLDLKVQASEGVTEDQIEKKFRL